MDPSHLTEGWLELESDPGLFSLLLEDMGVPDVQVEEIYDLGAPNLVNFPENGTSPEQQQRKSGALGFIFLFKWIEERRARMRKLIDEEALYVKEPKQVNSIFFAHQIVPNSCATHALLSILLNCPDLELGPSLSKLQNHVADMDPENKGLAIGNCPELAQAHNSHAVPLARRRQEKTNNTPTPGSRYTGETFHFVSYVPINGRLYELDGLKRFPIDHGAIEENTDWTEKFRTVITERLGVAPDDIRFALMALVPDRRKAMMKRLDMLKTNKTIVTEALKQLVKEEYGDSDDLPNIEEEEEEQDQEVEIIKSSTDDPESIEEFTKLEKDVNRLLKQREEQQNKDTPASSSASSSVQNKPLQRITSRASSYDSNNGASPGSPFRDDPLLVSHDYSKSPLMLDEMSSSDNSSINSFKTSTLVIAKEQVPEDFDPKTSELNEPHRFAPKDLLNLLRKIDVDLNFCSNVIKDENEKIKKHKTDDCRRVHNYDEFIATFITMLAEQNLLPDLLENGLNHSSSSSKKRTSLGNESVSSTAGNSGNSGGNSVSGSNRSRVGGSCSSNSKVNRKSSNRNQHRRGRPKKRK